MSNTNGLVMKYFVLKPYGTDQYARASRAAMRRYAKVIAAENPELSQELITWADREYVDAFGEDGIGADFTH